MLLAATDGTPPEDFILIFLCTPRKLFTEGSTNLHRRNWRNKINDCATKREVTGLFKSLVHHAV